MLSEQLFSVMKTFADPSFYQDLSTSVEISNVINQLSQGQLNTNREQYVFSCLIVAVQEVIESSLKKASDPGIKLELTKLHVELTQFQTASGLQITNSLFQRDYQITV